MTTKEPSGPVGYIKEAFLIPKNPTPSKEPHDSPKNPKGYLSTFKDPLFLRVYISPHF